MADYIETSRSARLKVLDLIYKAGTSHIGSNFSIIDVFSVLFDKIDLRKDKLILSAGWKAASLYYFLNQKGKITDTELDSYCQEGSKFIGLSEPIIPEIPFAGGSMGMGFPAAVGFALSKKLKGEPGKVYCVMSDGEIAIGTTWESSLIAQKHNLDNLVLIIDANGFQAMGKVDDILPAEFPGYGWEVDRIDGHDFKELKWIFDERGRQTAPRVVIAKTIKGKGWKRAEGNNLYHYKKLSYDEYIEALSELNDGILPENHLSEL